MQPLVHKKLEFAMPAEHQLLRWSLVVVWLATAFVSVWEIHGQSLELLGAAGARDAPLARLLIVGGAAADVLLGLAMAFKPSRLIYLIALGLMLAMTVAATLLNPGLWLHPLGPLTKNLPMVAVLCILARART